MSFPNPRILAIGTLIIVSSSLAHAADLIVHDLTNPAHGTLLTLGAAFVLGCALLAAGIVIAAFISKKK